MRWQKTATILVIGHYALQSQALPTDTQVKGNSVGETLLASPNQLLDITPTADSNDGPVASNEHRVPINHADVFIHVRDGAKAALPQYTQADRPYDRLDSLEDMQLTSIPLIKIDHAVPVQAFQDDKAQYYEVMHGLTTTELVVEDLMMPIGTSSSSEADTRVDQILPH